MQDIIKQMAAEAGFNLDTDTGLILDTAGVYSVYDAVRALAQAVARECAEIAGLWDEFGEKGDVIAEEIRARFGIEGK